MKHGSKKKRISGSDHPSCHDFASSKLNIPKFQSRKSPGTKAMPNHTILDAASAGGSRVARIPGIFIAKARTNKKKVRPIAGLSCCSCHLRTIQATLYELMMSI